MKDRSSLRSDGAPGVHCGVPFSLCVSGCFLAAGWLIAWYETSQQRKTYSQKQGALQRLISSHHIGAPGNEWCCPSPFLLPYKREGAAAGLGRRGPQRALCSASGRKSPDAKKGRTGTQEPLKETRGPSTSGPRLFKVTTLRKLRPVGSLQHWISSLGL